MKSSNLTRGTSMKTTIFCAFLLSFLSIAAVAQAISIPNPSPAVFGNAIQENGYFYPTSNVAVFKAYDLSEQVSNQGFEFGIFYWAQSSIQQVQVFRPTDIGAGHTSGIFFNTGTIVDFTSNSLVGNFSYNNQPVGFYLNIGSSTLFSDPTLNAGEDLFAAFPWLNGPSASLIGTGNPLLLAFGYPNSDGSVTTLALDFTDGIPTTAVPEPGTLMMVGTGIIYFAARMLRRKPE